MRVGSRCAGVVDVAPGSSTIPGVTADYTIRRATPAAAPTIAALGARLFTQAYGPTHPEPELTPYLQRSFDPGDIAAALERPEVVILLVEDLGGEPIGYAHTCSFEATLPNEPGSLPATEIERFYIDGAWHGRGVADALMTACHQVARAQGAARIFLQVWQEAPRAIAFYRRAGFAIAGETTFRFGERIDRDFVMVRTVSALAASPGGAH